jgi:predicted RNase H-like HicB family nuclease
MKTNVLRYNVIIKKEGKDYVAYVPTLGISDFGKTLELAKKHITAAIECHIEGLTKTKSEVPPPDTEEYYISHSEVIAPQGIKFAY